MASQIVGPTKGSRKARPTSFHDFRGTKSGADVQEGVVVQYIRQDDGFKYAARFAYMPVSYEVLLWRNRCTAPIEEPVARTSTPDNTVLSCSGDT